MIINLISSLAVLYKLFERQFLSLFLATFSLLILSPDLSANENSVGTFEEDSIEIQRLNEESFNVVYSDTEEAERLAIKAYRMAEKIQWGRGMAAGMMNRVNALYVRNEYYEANRLVLETIKLCDSLDVYDVAGRAYNVLANINSDFGDFDQAIENYETAIDFAEMASDSLNLVALTVNLGTVFLHEDQLDEAIKRFRKALRMIGAVKGAQKEYFQTAIYQNIGNAYRKKKDKDSALFFLIPTLEKSEVNDWDYISAAAHYAVAVAYNDSKEFSEALNHGLQAREYAQKVGAKDYTSDAWIAIANSYTGLKQFEEALDAQKKGIEIKDDRLEEEREVVKSQTKHEFEYQKKMAEMALTQQQELAKNRLVVSMVIGVFLCVAIVLVWVLFYQKRKITGFYNGLKAVNKSLEITAHESQLQTKEHHHLTFNLFNELMKRLSWQRSIDKNRSVNEYFNQLSTTLSDYMTMFNHLQHGVDQHNNNSINLDEDYLNDTIRNTIRTFDIESRADIDLKIERFAENLKLMHSISQIVRELMINSMKYAFSKKGRRGKLQVSIYKQGDTLYLEHQDDGPGFDLEKVTYSLGMKMIQIWVKNLRGKMNLNNKKGAFFVFEFPLQFN